MAEAKENGTERGPSLMDRLVQRIPERGVTLFGTFVLALVIGFLLAISGHLTLAMFFTAVAIVSVLSMLTTPSPEARARRVARMTPPDEGTDGGVSDADLALPVGTARPDLLVDTTAAPTAARRAIPAPPPEPPPMEDIVVEANDEDGTPAGNDDVWVE